MSDQSQVKATFSALIPHPAELRFLLLPTEGGWALPCYYPEESYSAQVTGLNKAMQEQLGINVTTLHCAYLSRDEEVKKEVNALFTMENHSPDWSPSNGACWAGRIDLASLSLVPEWQRPVIEAWLTEEETGCVPALRAPWSKNGWLHSVTDWTRTALAAHNIVLTGPMEQIKHWDISSVWRAPTGGADVYFKATPAIFASEPSMTAELAKLFPEHIPAPIAIATYADQGWMLLDRFDGKVVWEQTTDQKEVALRLLARMQIKSVECIDGLLSAGCLDRRLDKMAAQIADLIHDDAALARFEESERRQLRSLLPQITETCASLAAGPVPQALVHGDFHSGNIAIGDNGYIIFDWTDGCVSHPFFDMLTFLKPDADDFQRLRDAYLQEWSAFGSPQELLAIYNSAYKLGGLHHGLSYRAINVTVEASMKTEIEGAMEYFMRRYLAEQ